MSEEINKPFSPGDEVSCSFQGCERDTFVVVRVYECNNCYSKYMVVAHLKGDPSREIKGTIIDKVNYGIDSSWFKKANE